MTTPTPTDVDRAREYGSWLGKRTAKHFALSYCEATKLAALFAQARAEGEEAMREKAAQVPPRVYVDAVPGRISLYQKDPTIFAFDIRDAIRVLPTGGDT